MNRALSASVSIQAKQTGKQISGAGANEGRKISESKGAKGKTAELQIRWCGSWNTVKYTIYSTKYLYFVTMKSLYHTEKRPSKRKK